MTWTFNAATFHCATATFHGTTTAVTTKTQKVKPSYTGCKFTAFGGESIEVTVDTGCEYNLNAETEKVTLEGAGCKMQVTAPFCTITVEGTQTVDYVSYTNTGSGTTRELIVHVVVTGLKYTQSAFCPTGGGTFTNGTYNGSVQVTGENASKQHVGIWWA